ncbi:MAG: hypothetical protein ACRCYU_06665 [Nocardioides sp.]
MRAAPVAGLVTATATFPMWDPLTEPALGAGVEWEDWQQILYEYIEGEQEEFGGDVLINSGVYNGRRWAWVIAASDKRDLYWTSADDAILDSDDVDDLANLIVTVKSADGTEYQLTTWTDYDAHGRRLTRERPGIEDTYDLGHGMQAVSDGPTFFTWNLQWRAFRAQVMGADPFDGSGWVVADYYDTTRETWRRRVFPSQTGNATQIREVALNIARRVLRMTAVGTAGLAAAARRAAFTAAEQASPLARRPYDLRHACVSTWLAAGVPAPEVAAWAGHSVDVLLRVYAQCIDGQVDIIQRRVERALDEG